MNIIRGDCQESSNPRVGWGGVGSELVQLSCSHVKIRNENIYTVKGTTKPKGSTMIQIGAHIRSV